MSTGQYPKARDNGGNVVPDYLKSLAPVPNVPGGTVGVISGDLSRYSIFSMCLIKLLSYSGEVVTHFDWLIGSNITGNCNDLATRTVNEGTSSWLWMIGDDHAFAPDLLARLLSHDVDVVAPLCLQRSSPYPHVVYSGEDLDADEQGTHILHTDLQSSGLQEVYAVGGAGLLIKRHVLEAIGEPYFETYGKQNEDLEFCRKIRDAGFRIHVDCDALLGHIGNAIVWPLWSEQYGWGIRLNVGDDQNIFLRRFDNTRSLTPA